MTDHDQMENLLRSSLAERAQDVEVTPALYAEVQRRAIRGAWLRRGLVLAGAAAAVVIGVVAVPSLLPEPDVAPIMEQPETELPTDGPTEDAAPGDGEGLAAFDLSMAAAGIVWSDGESLLLPDESGVTRVALADGESVRMLAVESDPMTDQRWVAAAIRDGVGGGRVAWVGVEFDMGPDRAFVNSLTADPNGDGIVLIPGERPGVAWIEGRDLHVVPVDATGPEAVRVLPLEGDVPDGLVAQQWVAAADAQVLLATSPTGGVWSLPMDDSNVTNTGPTEPGFRLPDGDRALDALITPQLSPTLLLEGPLSGIGSALRPAASGDGTPSVAAPLPTPFDTSTTLVLTGNGSYTAVLLDTATGAGAQLLLDETGGFTLAHTWDGSAIAVTAAAPLQSGGTEATGSGGTTAADLGLTTDAPLIGTDGVELVLHTGAGDVERREVYPAAESEAVLGDLAVRPGSTSTDGLVAVESTSEGETTVRFVALDGSSAVPVGDVLLAVGEVTGLVWSEDGREIAWTDELGLRAARVVDSGSVPGGEATLLSDDTRPVIDWVWSQGAGGDTATGWLTVATAGGSEFLGVGRATDGTLTLSEPVGGSDRLSLDTHASPGAAVGPSVGAVLTSDGVELTWSGDGDQFGPLASPGSVGSDVRVDASGGQVLVLGAELQIMVTFDDTVLGLPFLTDWDVLD